jgi:hypothetical protein
VRAPHVIKATDCEIGTTDTFFPFDNDRQINDDTFIMQSMQLCISGISSTTEITCYIVGQGGQEWKKYSIPSALTIVVSTSDATKGAIWDVFSQTPLAKTDEYGAPSGFRIYCDAGACTASVYLTYTQSM